LILSLILGPAPVLFGDGAGPAIALNLGDAQAQALRNHPRLAAAQIEALIAEEGVRAARAGFFPTIQGYLTGVEAGNENTRILAGALNNPSIYDRAAAGLTLNQLITDFGHTKNMVAGSKLMAHAETENAAASREQILLEVDVAYFTALQERAILKVAKQTLATEQLLADQIKALASNQLKSELDVSFAMVGYEQALLVRQKAEGDDVSAEAALASSLGMHEPHHFVLGDVSATDGRAADLPTLIALALHSRPNLAQLRYESDAAKRFARAANDQSYPTLSAVGALGDSPSHDLHLPEHYAAAGVQLAVPFFEGGLYAARQHQAELQAQVAEENLRDAEDTTVKDVQIAQSNYLTADQRYRTAQQLVTHAEKAFQLEQARYHQGSSSIVELSQAQLNATSADITLAGAKYDALIQKAILDFQVGTIRAQPPGSSP
jgi:outer membrane protein